MSELKPCKCGEMPERQWSESFALWTYKYRFVCRKCKIVGRASEDMGEAIDDWNHRVGGEPAGEYTASNRPQDGSWRVGEGEKG